MMSNGITIAAITLLALNCVLFVIFLHYILILSPPPSKISEKNPEY